MNELIERRLSRQSWLLCAAMAGGLVVQLVLLATAKHVGPLGWGSVAVSASLTIFWGVRAVLQGRAGKETSGDV